MQNRYWNNRKTWDQIWSDGIIISLNVLPVQIYNFSGFESFLVLLLLPQCELLHLLFCSHLRVFLTGISLLTWRPMRDQALWGKSSVGTIPFFKYCFLYQICIWYFFSRHTCRNQEKSLGQRSYINVQIT